MGTTSHPRISTGIILPLLFLFFTFSSTSELLASTTAPHSTAITPPPAPTSSSASTSAAAAAALTQKKKHVLIAHGVLSILSLTFFIPLGASILRLNIPGPHILSIHICCQLLVYVLYVAGAGLGIWLTVEGRHYGLFEDPHGYVGVVVLVLMFLQPAWGYVHHLIYARRCANIQEGRGGKLPGRTVLSQFHVWCGRGLMAVGIINGGLGFRLTGKSEALQSYETTRRMETLYGVLVGVMGLVYAALVVRFEVARMRRTEPTEEEVAGGRRRVSEFGALDETEDVKAKEDERGIVAKEAE